MKVPSWEPNVPPTRLRSSYSGLFELPASPLLAVKMIDAALITATNRAKDLVPAAFSAAS
jgi:hypothetical protein